MDSWSHVFIFFTFCLSLFSHSLSPTLAATATATAPDNNVTTPSELVKKTCSHNQDLYAFCVEVLGSDPRTKTATDLLGLTKIALQIAISNSTTTRDYIQDAINKGKGSTPSKKTALEECLNSHENVVGSFKSALGETKDKEFDTASYDCMIAGDDARSCEQSMASGGFPDLTMSSGNEYAQRFSTLTITLTDLLDGGNS